MIYTKFLALATLKPNKQWDLDWHRLFWFEIGYDSGTAPTEAEIDAEVTKIK